jgi:hypothetical protein
MKIKAITPSKEEIEYTVPFDVKYPFYLKDSTYVVWFVDQNICMAISKFDSIGLFGVNVGQTLTWLQILCDYPYKLELSNRTEFLLAKREALNNISRFMSEPVMIDEAHEDKIVKVYEPNY